MKNVSHHLQRLSASGVVDRFRLGKRIIYSLADNAVGSCWNSLRHLAEQLVPDPLIDDRDSDSEHMSIEALGKLVSKKRVVVVDVRPRDEFDSGHVPGALSIPLDELSTQLKDLQRQVPVVAFCRGPYCSLADRAVELLHDAGFEALRCDDGILEWRAKGQPIQRKGRLLC